MKIGLYSLPLHANYGGILQSYALHTVLRSLGHEVYVLNQNWLDTLGKRDKIERAFFSVYNFFSREKKYSKRDCLIISINELRRFWSTNIYKFVDFREFEELKRFQLDAIVVGSDQIWRNGFCKDPKWYFLSFAKDWPIKRVAYAASFGVSEWQFDEQTTIEMKKLISLFNGVSVREKDAVGLCKQYLKTDAEMVLDPTFLLEKEKYDVICEKSVKCDKKRIVSFMLHPSQEKKTIVERVSTKLNALVIDIDVPIKTPNDRTVKPLVSIEKWLTSIKNADYVITDSYHGMAFSINFNKNFVTLGNVKAGQARFVSLLSMFGLSERMTTEEKQIEALFRQTINWENVNKVLTDMRKMSIQFLAESLQ